MFVLGRQVRDLEGGALLSTEHGSNFWLIVDRVTDLESPEAIEDLGERACRQFGPGLIGKAKALCSPLGGVVAQTRLGRLAISQPAPVRGELGVELLHSLAGADAARVIGHGDAGADADGLPRIQMGKILRDTTNEIPDAIPFVRARRGLLAHAGDPNVAQFVAQNDGTDPAHESTHARFSRVGAGLRELGWRTHQDSNLRPLPSEGNALSS